MTSARSVRLIDEESTFANVRAAEREESLRRNAMAAKTVADHSVDADECSRLLAMLGLDLSELR
ncbi:hypothetical protein [Nocardia sp. alder85J]|uniref:hypothetical protein n=1 Tax=Nocardia sp. alder85J TaxID=2862949 RepID=UPI001CD60F03|nr:hypothetical protein [Nocardia sp. alder85J]MCX4094647.1 hypothetical protein [Nocardia sp. alder85J]